MLYVRAMGLTTVLRVQSLRCQMFRPVCVSYCVSNLHTINTCAVLSQSNTLVGHCLNYSSICHAYVRYLMTIGTKLIKRFVLAAHLSTLWTACL